MDAMACAMLNIGWRKRTHVVKLLKQFGRTGLAFMLCGINFIAGIIVLLVPLPQLSYEEILLRPSQHYAAGAFNTPAIAWKD